MPKKRALTDRSRRDERRAAMLETAIQVISKKGVDCSIDDIAAKVGVTRPIIYRFFESRDGLARAVGADTVTRVRAQMVEAMGHQHDGRAMVAAGIDAYLRFIEDEPQLYRYLIRGPGGRGAGDDGALGDFIDRLGREIAVVFGELMNEAGRDTGTAEPWAFAVIGMVGVTGEWWLDRGAMSRTRLTEYLTQLVWDGIGSSLPHQQQTTDDLASRHTDDARRGAQDA